MKKFFIVATFFFASTCFACAKGTDTETSGKSNVSEYQTTVSGRVTCQGQPVVGAVISDGIELTQTDANGHYTLRSPERMGYVFISVPSGYKVAHKGVLPNHYLDIKSKKTENADFELLPMADKKYKLFVMADVHLIGSATHRDLEQFRSTFLPDITAAVDTTSEEVFSLSLGDMTTDSRWYHENFMLPNYLKEFKNYPSPIYHIMGNHDNDPSATGTTEEKLDWSASALYRKHIGQTYYSLNIGDVHYVMLDNIVGLGNCKYKYLINSAQLAWLKKDLALVDKSTPLIVSMHVPAYTYTGISDGKPMTKKRNTQYQDVQVLINILKPFKEAHILTGHDHRNRNIQITHNILEHNFASASAISWKLNDVRIMTTDGTLSGYQIFDISGKQIQWHYKAVGLTPEKSQFRAYDLNTVPEKYGGNPASNEILVNVFNWDPRWKISVTEDGQELPVEQLWEKDPLYMYIRDKTQRFNNRPKDWRAVNCIHMFHTKATEANSEIVVSVTDRFGNVYTEKMDRPKPFTENMN